MFTKTGWLLDKGGTVLMNCDPLYYWKVKFPDNTGWDKEKLKPQVQLISTSGWKQSLFWVKYAAARSFFGKLFPVSKFRDLRKSDQWFIVRLVNPSRVAKGHGGEFEKKIRRDVRACRSHSRLRKPWAVSPNSEDVLIVEFGPEKPFDTWDNIPVHKKPRCLARFILNHYDVKGRRSFEQHKAGGEIIWKRELRLYRRWRSYSIYEINDCLSRRLTPERKWRLAWKV